VVVPIVVFATETLEIANAETDGSEALALDAQDAQETLPTEAAVAEATVLACLLFALDSLPSLYVLMLEDVLTLPLAALTLLLVVLTLPLVVQPTAQPLRSEDIVRAEKPTPPSAPLLLPCQLGQLLSLFLVSLCSLPWSLYKYSL
jgi:hypothetical protein